MPYSTPEIGNFNNISCKFLNMNNDKLEDTGVSDQGFVLGNF